MAHCPAALMIRGKYFPCDWPLGEDGTHIGWAHTNAAASAVWTEDRSLFGGADSPFLKAERVD